MEGRLNQPLVSRPPYGEGQPRTPQAEAKLPEGGPADRGLPVDDEMTGYKTFAKPEDDYSTTEYPENDEPIERVRGPRDLLKDRGRIDVNDQTDAQPHYDGLGKPDPNTPNKTKYPYRDDKPNAHNASAEFVAGLYRVEHAHTVVLSPTSPVKVAATKDEILSGLNRKFKQRAKTCASVLKRVDSKNLRWIFSVDCGHGPKVVKVKAIRSGNVVDFAKLDLELSCSCKAWQWLGPEFHSTTKDYQLGTPRGTASTPDIRDPRRINKVCKHVASVLSATRDWSIPKASKPKRK
jgi:hypothetical protein